VDAIGLAGITARRFFAAAFAALIITIIILVNKVISLTLYNNITNILVGFTPFPFLYCLVG
jgi:hypothetical protein